MKGIDTFTQDLRRAMTERPDLRVEILALGDGMMAQSWCGVKSVRIGRILHGCDVPSLKEYFGLDVYTERNEDLLLQDIKKIARSRLGLDDNEGMENEILAKHVQRMWGECETAWVECIIIEASA